MITEPVQEVLELEALRQLKARYFRFIDTKDFEALATVFTEDFRYLDDAKDLVLDGRERFVDFIAERHRNSVSAHQGHNPELALDSETEAHGIWAMTDFVILPGAGNGRLIQRGYGHYRERYRKENDGWKIARTHLSRIWLTIENQYEEFSHVNAHESPELHPLDETGGSQR